MLHFCKFFLVLLFATIALLPRPSSAASIPTCDLDSLCYMSTDVVEANFVWQRPPGQPKGNYVWEAVVVDPIEGQYHAGDVIGSADFGLYKPPPLGPRTILFVARKQFYVHWYPSETVAPQVVGILYTDSHNHIRRYFQWGDPGGLVAEGYMPQGVPEQNGLPEQHYPTLAEERATIASKWTAIDRLRPLLSHDPRPADVPALLDLLRHRPMPAGNRFGSHALEDGLATVICARLADLDNPSLAIDVMSMNNVGEETAFLSGLETESFRTPASLGYAHSIV